MPNKNKSKCKFTKSSPNKIGQAEDGSKGNISIKNNLNVDSDNDDEVLLDSDTTVRILGQGYNIVTQNTVPSEIFKYKTKKTPFGFLVPESAGFSTVCDTETFLEWFKNNTHSGA